MSLWLEHDAVRSAKLRGQEQAISKEVELATRKLIRQNPELLGPDFITLLEKVGTAKALNAKPYAFITVNPYPDADRIWFKSNIETVVQKRWVRNIYSYSFEEDEKGRYHVHMIVFRGSKPKSEIIREIYSTVKDMVGDPSCIDVELIPMNNRKVYKYCHKSMVKDEKSESDIFLEKFFVSDDSSSEEQEGDT